MIGLVKSRTVLHAAALVPGSYSHCKGFGQANSLKFFGIKKTVLADGLFIDQKPDSTSGNVQKLYWPQPFDGYLLSS